MQFWDECGLIPTLVLNVVDDRVLLSAVVLDGGRLDLAGDVGVSDVFSIVAEQVVDELVRGKNPNGDGARDRAGTAGS